jgi:hypothetical protein
VQAAACVNSDHGACVGDCTDLTDLEADTSQCSTELDRVLSCFEGLSDICMSTEIDPDTGKVEVCNAEVEDFLSCYADYCADHPSESFCS